MFTKPFNLNFWQKWLRVAHSEHNKAYLGTRKIYILPTRWGVIYGLLVIVLLLGSINYSLSLGYYITFLLASLGHTAMLYTWRNLVHLEIEVMESSAVFAENIAQIPVTIQNPKSYARYAIRSYFEKNSTQEINIAANKQSQVQLNLSTERRGWLTLPKLTLYTEFPLNLLHAWAIVKTTRQVLVYPKPAPRAYAPNTSISLSHEGKKQSNHGDEEFNGHKGYQHGDAPSRVDWKASSRSTEMLTKQYSGNSESLLWLNWADTVGDHETRISQLTRWVIDAHQAGLHYGLNIPSQSLAPDNNRHHYKQALSLLALMP